jgi:hypothetical protein
MSFTASMGFFPDGGLKTRALAYTTDKFDEAVNLPLGVNET